MNWDSSVRRLRAERPGLDPVRGRDFFLHHRIETASWTYLATHPMGTGFFPRG